MTLRTNRVAITPRASREELRQIHAELAMVRQHPDWEQICEMRVAYLDAFLHFGDVEKALEEASGKDHTGVVPVDSPMPDIVSRALKAELTSAFAKATQEEIQQRLRAHERFLHHLRGEPQ